MSNSGDQQALRAELVVNDLQDAQAQVMFLQQVAKAQDADPVGDSVGAAQPAEVTVDRHLKQGFFSPQIRQPEPLLQTVNAQHHFQIKWRPSSFGHERAHRNQRPMTGMRSIRKVKQKLLSTTPLIPEVLHLANDATPKRHDTNHEDQPNNHGDRLPKYLKALPTS